MPNVIDHPIDQNGALTLRMEFDPATNSVHGSIVSNGNQHFENNLAENVAGLTTIKIGDTDIKLQKTQDATGASVFSFDAPLSDNGAGKIPLQVEIGNQTFGQYNIDPQAATIEGAYTHRLVGFETRLIAEGFNGDGPLSVPYDRSQKPDFIPSTDLHTHLAGNLSGKALIEIALARGEGATSYPSQLLDRIGIDTAGYENTGGKIALSALKPADLIKLENAMSIPTDKQDTFNGMESIYELRAPITKDKALFADILREIGKDYASGGTKYAELSHASIITDPELLQIAHEVLPQIEQQHGVKLRFMGAMWRHSDKEWNADEVDRIKAIAKDPYVVGADFMGHETNPTRDFAGEIKEVAKWAIVNDPDFTIRIHAGENPLFASSDFKSAKETPWAFHNVKEALQAALEARQEVAEARGVPAESLPMPRMRIGHGLYGLDEDTVRLFKETGAIVEFNMSSNLALNNINDISEVPIKKYVEAGIPVVLGHDGKGVYKTAPEQEAILAHAAGLTQVDFDKIGVLETAHIARDESRFAQKQTRFAAELGEAQASGLSTDAAFKAVMKPTYETPDGQPRMTAEIAAQYRAAQEAREAELKSRLGITYDGKQISTDPALIAQLEGKTPILITGASEKSWPNISPAQQAEIQTAMQAMANWVDPEKAYLMTGGTNHGVERQLHEAGFRSHQGNPENGLQVVGAFTAEALALKSGQVAKINDDTITGGTILKTNGKVVENWFGLQDAALGIVERQGGEVIAIGGGPVVRDMIQRAHNTGLSLHLMDGPEGASTEKAAALRNNGYDFVGAKGLLEHLHESRPELFKPGFDITQVDQYVAQAKEQIPNLRKTPTPAKVATVIKWHEVDFSPEKSTAVVSGAMKYILPVPNDKGEALVYPETVTDVKGQVHEKGSPITDYKGNPLEGTGVAVYNSSEKIYQAGIGGKEGDARGVIIINHVTEEKAAQLDGLVNSLTGNKPENLTFDQFKQVEGFARELGLTNMYDSDVKFAKKNLQDPFSGKGGEEVSPFGFKKRDARDRVQAVFVEGPAELHRADGTPLPIGEDGAVLLKQGDSVRVITHDDFTKTYRSADGFQPITHEAVKPAIITPSIHTGEMLKHTDGIEYAVLDTKRVDFADADHGRKTQTTGVRIAKPGEEIITNVGKTEESRYVAKGGEAIFINSPTDQYVPPNGLQILADKYELVSGSLEAGEASFRPKGAPSKILHEAVTKPTVIKDAWGPGQHQFLAAGATLKLNDDGKVTGIGKEAFDKTWAITDDTGKPIVEAKTRTQAASLEIPKGHAHDGSVVDEAGTSIERKGLTLDERMALKRMNQEPQPARRREPTAADRMRHEDEFEASQRADMEAAFGKDGKWTDVPHGAGANAPKPGNGSFHLQSESNFHNPSAGQAYAIAGLLNRAADIKEHGASKLDIAAVAADTAGLSKSAGGNAAGLAGNLIGIVSQAEKGYEKGGINEAAYQGGKAAGSSIIGAEIMAPGSTLAQVKQLKDLPGAVRNIVPAVKEGVDALKGAASAEKMLATAKSAKDALTLKNAGSLAGGVANVAGRAGLINSAVTVGSDALDYATGRKELNLDNATGTALDTVVNLDPLKAITGIAGLTKLVGVDTGIQNVSISSIMDRGLGVVGVTEGKGEQIGDIKNETQAIYKEVFKPIEAKMLDENKRKIDADDPNKPKMTDYEYLALVRGQVANFIPGGKIDGHDVRSEFDKIDFTKKENYAAYKQGMNALISEQMQIRDDNASMLPSWIRSGESATKYNYALDRLNVLNAAEGEFAMFQKRVNEYNTVKAQESALSGAVHAEIKNKLPVQEHNAVDAAQHNLFAGKQTQSQGKTV